MLDDGIGEVSGLSELLCTRSPLDPLGRSFAPITNIVQNYDLNQYGRKYEQ